MFIILTSIIAVVCEFGETYDGAAFSLTVGFGGELMPSGKGIFLANIEYSTSICFIKGLFKARLAASGSSSSYAWSSISNVCTSGPSQQLPE